MSSFLKGLLAAGLLWAGLAAGTAWGSALPEAVARALEAPDARAAADQLEAALGQRGLSSADQLWIRLYLAESLRLAGEPVLARQQFERVATGSADPGAANAARLGLALIDGAGNPGGNILATLTYLSEDSVPDTLNADRFLALVSAGLREHAPEEEMLIWAKKARAYAASDEAVQRRVSRELGRLGIGSPAAQVATPAPAAAATAPAATSTSMRPVLKTRPDKGGKAAPGAEQPGGQTAVKPEGQPAAGEEPLGPPDQLAIEALRAAVWKGDAATVLQEAGRFTAELAGSPYAAEAGWAQKRAAAGVWPKRSRVAVLLPQSGTWAPAGRNLRVAMELAAAGSGLELVFYDTAGSGTTCTGKLEEAFLKQGAAMVIGPLLKEEAQQCAPMAQAMHLPMVALTSWEDVAAAGDQVFRAYPSTNQLINGLLRETWDVRAMRRYGVLYPKNNYGETARAAFVAALKAKGTAPVAAVAYETTSVDFRKTAVALKTALAGEVLDALFIPDAYQRVALIASALAFEDLSVGRFRGRSGPITLIGLNGWHNPELVRRGGQYVQDSIFIDAFYEDVDDPVVGGFIDAYKGKVGAMPTLVEAVGYDSVRLAAAAAGRAELPDEALRLAQLKQPLTGMLTMGADRQWSRSWRLLTITSGGIEPLPVWAPPEQ